VVEDFRDALTALIAQRVRFLVVGAHALAAHGVPRATVDLDVWVDPVPDNAHRVWRALSEFGAPLASLGIAEADFHRPEIVVQLGLPPYRIDVLTSVSGLTFDLAWADRIEAVVEDVRSPVLGLDSFVRNKRASGRKKDLADLEALGIE
jgi:hypothetical protein